MQMLPSAGQGEFSVTKHGGSIDHIRLISFHLLSSTGAVNAMQDAVILANCIYDLTDLEGHTFTKAFQTYSTLRRPYVVAQMQASEKNAELLFSQVKPLKEWIKG